MTGTRRVPSNLLSIISFQVVMGRRFWGLCLGAALMVLFGVTVGKPVFRTLVFDLPLRLAMMREDYPRVWQLIDAGADPNGDSPLMGGTAITPLWIAVMEEDTPRVKSLLAKGASTDRSGSASSPLEMALWGKDLAIAKMLLEAGADSNSEDEFTGTPLWFIASRTRRHPEQQQIARAMLLLKHGADPNRKRKYLTPGAVAELKSRKLLAQLLRDHGGEGLAECLRDIEELGPLTAVKSRQFAAIKALINRGVPFDTFAEDKGTTPLIEAISSRSESLAQLVIERAPHRRKDWLEIPDGEGLTPLHHAVRVDSPRTVRRLIRAGSRVDARDSDGNTPLHFASSKTIPLLLAAGADLDARNGAGLTPREFALSLDNHHAAILLSQAEERLASGRSQQK